jgi:hypothetical protein
MPRLSWDQVSGYLDDVYQRVEDFLRPRTMAELAEPGYGFDGKFTKYQIITMAMTDNIRHLGEIQLIKSLFKRHRDRG